MPADLPPTFFLYIRSRHAAHDPFSGFILCDALKEQVVGQPAWKITPRPYASMLWTLQCQKDKHFAESYMGQYTLQAHDQLMLAKKISATTIWCATGNHTPLLVSDSSGVMLPVLEFAKHTTVFGSYQLKRNVVLQWQPAPAPGTPLPAPAQPGAATIQHVPAPAPKKLKAAKPSGYTELAPFVAKQLLELAQSKHEMCPITAEEYIAGETAAMPCGHLFMRMAIEETFKKEPNKCPACRQLGSPSYC